MYITIGSDTRLHYYHHSFLQLIQKAPILPKKRLTGYIVALPYRKYKPKTSEPNLSFQKYIRIYGSELRDVKPGVLHSTGILPVRIKPSFDCLSPSDSKNGQPIKRVLMNMKVVHN